MSSITIVSTFIVQASVTIVTYDRQNMFIIQATGDQPFVLGSKSWDFSQLGLVTGDSDTMSFNSHVLLFSTSIGKGSLVSHEDSRYI